MTYYILCNDLIKNKKSVVNVLSNDMNFSEQCKKIYEHLKTTHLNSNETLEYIDENNEFTIYSTEKVTLQGWIYNTNKSVKVDMYKFSLIEIHDMFSELVNDPGTNSIDDSISDINISENDDLSDRLDVMDLYFSPVKYNNPAKGDYFSYFSETYRNDNDNDTTVYLNDPFKVYYDFLATNSMCNVYSQTEPNIVYDNTKSTYMQTDNEYNERYDNYDESESGFDCELENDSEDCNSTCNLICQTPFIDKINKSLIRQQFSMPQPIKPMTLNIEQYNYRPSYIKDNCTKDMFISELKDTLKMPQYNLRHTYNSNEDL